VVTAVHAAMRSIADLLDSEFAVDPVFQLSFGPGAGAGQRMGVFLNTPAQMIGSRSGLSVWLYRVVRDENTLNRSPKRVTSSLTERVPLPVKLHILLTPCTNIDGDDAQETDLKILGKALQTLEATPCLAGNDLKADFAGTDTKIFMRLEMLTLDEITRIWDALESSYQPCLSYEVSVVDIDINKTPERVTPVRIPVPQIGVLVGGSV
jgi:hypothetical protein